MPEIIIITGAINSGKSTYLQELVTRERASGRPPSGVIAHAAFEDHHKIGYDIEDLATGMILPLARAGSHREGDQRVGGHSLSAEALASARAALLNFAPGGVVFLDEAGPLELSGGGYAACIRALLESPISTLYIVVREGLVDQVRERFLQGRSVKVVRASGHAPPGSQAMA